MPRISARALRALAAAAVIAAVSPGVCANAHAQAGLPDSRPYDEKLMQLAEILGAMHFLRELCGANDGMLWRDRMRELIDADGSTAIRRARLTRSFNNGYRSYSRTYATCTPSAQMAIARFLKEGPELADGLVRSSP